MKHDVVLYSAEMCGDCQKIKNYMESNGIDYELRDIQKNPAYADEVTEKTGKLGVQYLIIDGEWIRGYELDKPFSDEFARSLFNDQT